ncbi:MAG: HAMP domain-containing histidine kinase [Flavobacteriaceae bacterium]|nr:HAMP domain-containing histidine kinase [Flavobacteriaceae bacterium]
MNKIKYSILVLLMSISLIGIIFVQSFWIKTTLDNRERQFSLNVNQALKTVTETIKDREMRDYLAVYQKLIDSIGEPQESQLTSVFQYINRNQNTNQTFVYSHGILEEDYNITSSLLESKSSDTTNIKDYKSLKTTTIIDDAFDREMQNMSSIERLQRVEKMSLIDRAKYESVFSDLAKLKPIHKRVNNVEIELLLQRELRERDLDLDYDYRVFDGELATKVGSDRYTNLEGVEKFSMPLFANDKGETNFSLVIGFPNRVSYLRSSISFLIILSIVFTLVIIISFVSTILSSIRQKNISEMKTDFINNMTHEFKTPIATIDLALNAVKNEKVKKDNTLVDKYLNIIKEENKRMNLQVENVLKISQLENKNILLNKTKININHIILKSVASVKLLLDEKNGSIDLKLCENIIEFEFAFDEMINVFINILDNSIKYSREEPKIHIETFMDQNQTKVKISDNGIGMSTKVKNKIFENFYRETKGNIHNIKGHGLGLSYVKQIVDLHGGTISVSSDLNKGTSFILSFNV